MPESNTIFKKTFSQTKLKKKDVFIYAEAPNIRVHFLIHSKCKKTYGLKWEEAKNMTFIYNG